MLMGYLHLKCSECQTVVRHHSKDVEVRKVRICPKCGQRIEVSTPCMHYAADRR